MALLRRTLVAGTSLLLVACSDSPTEPRNGPAAVLVIQGSTGIIAVGDSLALAARVTDARGTTLPGAAVAWRSLDPSIASVDSLGRVRGEEAGVTAVIARAGDVADTVTIGVEIQPRQLELVTACCSAPDSVSVGAAVTLQVVLRDGRGRVLSTAATPTITVDDTTLATAPAWSPTQRTASSVGLVGGTATYTARLGALEARRTITYRLQRVPLAGVPLSQVGFGKYFGCGLDAGGRANCWGTNESGQLGRGGSASQAWAMTPAPVTGGLAFAKLVVGASGACGITSSRKLWCWGRSGQPWESTAPTAILAEAEVTDVVIGTYHYQTCARTTDGALWCWGIDAGVRIAPRRVDVPATVDRIALGYRYDWTFACGLTTAGRATCTGLAFAPDSAFREVPGSYPPLASVVVGSGFGCGLDAQGRAWCWGSDASGARGTGSLPSVWDPNANAVLTTQRFTALAAGADFACGITAEGAIWCWGRHQAFPFQTRLRTTPVRISRDETFRSMLATDDAICGVRADGNLGCEGAVLAPST